MKNKNILISGAGIAGLALGQLLKGYGFNPTIVEKHACLRAEGYKIDIRGVAVDVLRRMGVHAAVVEERTDIRVARFVNSTGECVSEEDPDLCGVRAEGDLEIVRGKLCEILYRQLDGVECLFGDSIEAITEHESGLDVTFASGQKRCFDLVIGADGLHSKVRRLTWGEESQYLRKLGMYVSFYTIPNYMGLDRVEIEYHLARRFAIAYCPKDGAAKAGFAMAAEADQPDPENREAQQQFLERAFGDAGWEVPRMLQYMRSSPDFYFDVMAQVCMPKWTRGRAVLVGDAGYAVSPMAGQGASVALVGAYVLAGELARAGGDYVEAFRQYEATLQDYVVKNQALADMSASLLTGKYTSWFAAKAIALSYRLGRLLPASWIRYWKQRGLRRTTEAANAVSLDDYSLYNHSEQGSHRWRVS